MSFDRNTHPMSRNIALGKQLQHRFAASSLTQQATLWSQGNRVWLTPLVASLSSH